MWIADVASLFALHDIQQVTQVDVHTVQVMSSVVTTVDSAREHGVSK